MRYLSGFKFNYLASAKKVIGLLTACHNCVLTCHLSGNIQDDLHQRQGVDSRKDREREKKVMTEHPEIRLLNSVVILATIPIAREAVINCRLVLVLPVVKVTEEVIVQLYEAISCGKARVFYKVCEL